MDRILQLLSEKNHYLEKFYTLNENELINFGDSNFDNLEFFYGSREDLLGVLKYINEQIDLEQAQLDPAKMELSVKKEIHEHLRVKDDFITKILSQDLQILSYIEEAKSQIIRDLQGVKQTKKAIGAYKSKSPAKRLDEEV